tara:strand:- start:1610 stop:2224 length:615 start_codon:yes stop_codon:yes gene_type:complete
MITLIDKNNKLAEQKNSLSITYPRKVNVIFGNYPYVDVVNNLLIDIKNNLIPSMEDYTYVEGQMTDWYHFIDKPNFINFINFLINKHQTSHPFLFEYFMEKTQILNAWGTQTKKGQGLKPHMHNFYHGILYLTEGCELELPELNIKIKPSPGDYYIFPPQILHGFEKHNENSDRYSLIFNLDIRAFEFSKKISNHQKKFQENES